MARRRNEDIDRAIKAAAWSLFTERGYAHVTFSDIAKQAGTTKSQVQHYFPQKSLLARTCLEALYRGAAIAVSERQSQTTDILARFFLVGQAYIASFFVEGGPTLLITDILDSRELTMRTINLGFSWSLEYASLGTAETGTSEMPDMLVATMGGFYELIYIYLKRGTWFDIPEWVKTTIVIFAQENGLASSEGEEKLDAFAMSHAELEQFGRQTCREAAKIISG